MFMNKLEDVSAKIEEIKADLEMGDKKGKFATGDFGGEIQELAALEKQKKFFMKHLDIANFEKAVFEKSKTQTRIFSRIY